ncbi:hypothetical protein [Capybara microvirus Cap1_SP_159]|nr:hypothetical protein [Capybara microvirus Cap1_SP_159]
MSWLKKAFKKIKKAVKNPTHSKAFRHVLNATSGGLAGEIAHHLNKARRKVGLSGKSIKSALSSRATGASNTALTLSGSSMSRQPMGNTGFHRYGM